MKTLRLLIVWKANHSTKSSVNYGSKVKWKKKFQEEIFENFGIPHEVVLFFGNFWKCPSICYWKSLKIQTESFSWMKSVHYVEKIPIHQFPVDHNYNYNALVYPRKPCIAIVFDFSWHGRTVMPSRNWKQWLCKIWGVSKVHCGLCENGEHQWYRKIPKRSLGAYIF